MIITASEINLSSSYSYQEHSIAEERLELWSTKQTAGTLINKVEEMWQDLDSAEISTEALKAFQVKSNENEDSLFSLSPKDKLKISMIQMFMKRLTGKDFHFILPKEFRLQQNANKGLPRPANGSKASAQPGWGLSYEARSYYHEAEQSSFKAKGIVQTSDGKRINISVQLNLSREFTMKSEFRLQAGSVQAIDPLVINYEGTAASLTERTFAFDLTNNGIMEQIAFVKPGSGFLVLDKNGDGIINDGSELFGPATGNGFIELAKYDEDGNGWIDEGDSVYAELKIWSKDEAGNDLLISVSDAGIGAIMLAHIDTPFTITDSGNQALGLVQQSSIFLREDGSAGTVQQIDLVV